eukprot:218521-Rhodomonas_salina.2
MFGDVSIPESEALTVGTGGAARTLIAHLHHVQCLQHPDDMCPVLGGICGICLRVRCGVSGTEIAPDGPRSQTQQFLPP